jgi:hypothetical protein
MDAQFYVEVLRLHGEHLRTLIDQVITELTTFEYALALEGNPASAIEAPQLDTWEKQSEHLAAETLRLRGFLQSLRPQRTGASDATGESPPTFASAISHIPQKGRCKIVCTLSELAKIL